MNNEEIQTLVERAVREYLVACAQPEKYADDFTVPLRAAMGRIMAYLNALSWREARFGTEAVIMQLLMSHQMADIDGMRDDERRAARAWFEKQRGQPPHL